MGQEGRQERLGDERCGLERLGSRALRIEKGWGKQNYSRGGGGGGGDILYWENIKKKKF